MPSTAERRLPIPVVQDEPHATAYMRFTQLFADSDPGRYLPLPTDEGPTVPVFATPNVRAVPHARAPAEPLLFDDREQNSTTEFCAPPANLSSYLCTALFTLAWYARMCVLLVVLCATATFLASVAGWFVGTVAVLGWFTPYSTLTPVSALQACAAGAGVVGVAVGLAAFVMLVVRRMWAGEGVPQSARRAPDSFWMREFEHSPDEDSEAQMQTRCDADVGGRDGQEHDEDGERDPVEISVALLVSVAASAGAMAVGVAIVPGLTAESFGVRHALALGVWGMVIPVLPFALLSFVCALWECNPMAGATCFGHVCCRNAG